MTVVYTKRPLPIGVTVVRSQTKMELGPDELVEKLSRQGFIETEKVRNKREADAKKNADDKKAEALKQQEAAKNPAPSEPGKKHTK